MTAEQIVESVKAGRGFSTVSAACLPALEALVGSLDPAIADRVWRLGTVVMPHAMAAQLIGYSASSVMGDDDGELSGGQSEMADRINDS